jgi:uncharacterized small protein (DUF1192 family)
VSEEKIVICPMCEGKGEVLVISSEGDFDYMACSNCNGTGEVIEVQPSAAMEGSATMLQWEIERLKAQLAAEKQRAEKAESDLAAGKKFLSEDVTRLRELAMEISLKYEPCGYYCDPGADGYGHHDHKLYNMAKYLFGDGVKEYLPESLRPDKEKT